MTLQVDKLSKKYNKRVISNFSYIFKEGKIYSITGKSGCGKSTFLNILSGIDNKYTGNIYLNNINIKKMQNYTIKDISYVYQNHQLFDDLTVIENILLPLILTKKDMNNIKEKVIRLLKLFNILHLKENKVKDLSGGEKQRIALIRALIKDYKILLLDEPTSALDEFNKQILMDYLNKIKNNVIIIIVTHDSFISLNADENIDINKKYSIDRRLIISSYKKEKRIKIANTNLLSKKVFKINKLFSYMASSITTFALLCICLCEVLTTFINDVINSSFSPINTANFVSMMSFSNEINIDFNRQIHNKYPHIHYQGIKSDIKNNIKQNTYIEGVYLNDYKLIYTTFIFDNYVSDYEEEVVLHVSQIGALNIYENNYLYVIYNQKKYTIKIDKVYLSQDDSYSIYCNNLKYIDDLLNDLACVVEYDNYLYSKDCEQLYDFLINDSKYINYNFYLYKERNVIHYYQNTQSRITNADIKYFMEKYNINYYVYSDYSNTYIDYDTGLLYVIIDDELVQVTIDDKLEDEHIKVSIKFNGDVDKIIISNRTLLVDNIVDEKNYEIIYMNHNTFNNLNVTNNKYVLLLNTIDKMENDRLHIIINSNLFNMSNISVFKYMTSFILVYGIIISIIAIISLKVIFNLNLLNKQKDIQILKKLGVYKINIVLLVIYEPVEILISSILSSFFAYIAIKYMTSYVYYLISKNIISVKISYVFYLIVSALSLFIIIPPLIVNIKKNIKK